MRVKLEGCDVGDFVNGVVVGAWGRWGAGAEVG